MRVFELAKELNIASKDLLARLHTEGVDAKNHMSAVPVEVVERLRAALQPKPVEAKKAAPPEPQPPAAPKKPVAAPPKPVAAETKKTPPAPAKPAAAPVEKTTPPPPRPPATPSAAPAGGRTIVAHGPIIVREFAGQLGLKPNQLIAELMMMNVLASINEKLDFKTAQQIAEKHGYTLEHERKPAETHVPEPTGQIEEKDRPEDLRPRPPVVTFMGHIDHGKTSLLDYIRKSAVAKSEAGGITQHIGAYTVRHKGHSITFLDTPGHAAFTAMRARGANLTDIAVIVIAADDGVMPQTEEAIKHAQAADTTIMIAINKMDLPNANPDRVKRQLQERGLTPEDWGGEIICCPVSAQTGAGVDHLLEMLLLQAEMLELKANPRARAEGYVIEAQMESGSGPTAALLVTRGTLRVGDALLCGVCYGRVRALLDDQGRKIKEAGPSTPVKCLGLSGVPAPGDAFKAYPDERTARKLAEEREQQLRQSQLAAPPRKASLENLLERMAENRRLELRLLIKCDTQGSIEAIRKVLEEITSEKVQINIILTGVGAITENDVLLASASDAVIIGFNVAKTEAVARAAKQEGVEIRLYSIIYTIADDIREAMVGMLAPELREKMLGRAEVRQVFPISKAGKIAGCLVVSGRVRARSRVRVKRGGELLYEGAIMTLKRFQDEVAEVREGQECGIRLDNYAAFEPGDILECFEIEKLAPKL